MSPRPRLFRRCAAAGAAAAVLFCAVPQASASSQDPALATYRGGAVTRSEFEGFQTWKSGAEGYRALMKDRPALRAALLRQAMLEVVGALARENGLHRRADFKAAVKQQEDGLLAGLWGRKVRDAVTLTDAELDRMVPEQEDEVHVLWASLPNEEEARRFAGALQAGAAFGNAAAKAGIPAPMVGEARLSPGGQTHFSQASVARILALAEGEVAGPLPEPIGWYVAQAAGRADAERRRALKREQLRPDVLKAKREQAYAEALARLRAAAKIEIDEDALAKADRAPGKSVATVNGEKVFFRPQEQHGFPQHAEMGKILRRDLERQIDELLAAQQARRERLAEREPGFADRVGYLALETLVERYREQVYQSIAVTEEEARAYYERNPELFKSPAMVRPRQIVLQSRYLAERYRADLLAGRESFEDLAKRESADRASAAVGGDQGWIPENRIREELRPFVEALRPGEISVPVDVSGNYYLVKLDARAEPEPIPYEKIREKVRSRALLAKRSDSYQEFIARKQREMQVKVDDAALEALVAP